MPTCPQRLWIALTALAFSASAQSQLTPVGAEAAASADGAIPTYTDGLRAFSARRSQNRGERLNHPYAADAPLFAIDQTSMDNHAALLSAGHKQLLSTHDSYRIAVYPTRRSVSFPQEIEQASLGNEASARLVNADEIEGVTSGVPFRRPKTGVEVIWNHRLRYRGQAHDWVFHRGVRHESGDLELNQARWMFQAHYNRLAASRQSARDDMIYQALLFLEPAEEYPRFQIVAHESLSPGVARRKLWGNISPRSKTTLIPGDNDALGIFSRKIRFGDMFDVFSGITDAYVYKLIGKREMIVPYNAFAFLVDVGLLPEDVLTPDHLNPDFARYERHRVWVVEASLREGKGHTFDRRVFYVDEDSWAILMVDCYTDGNLVRFQEGHLLPVYPTESVAYAPHVVYQFDIPRYFATRLPLNARPPKFDDPDVLSARINPSALRRRHKIE